MEDFIEVRCVYDWKAQSGRQFDMSSGDLILVTKTDDSGWWSGVNQTTQKKGLFPVNYTENLDPQNKSNLTIDRSKVSSGIKSLQVDIPPPPFSHSPQRQCGLRPPNETPRNSPVKAETPSRKEKHKKKADSKSGKKEEKHKSLTKSKKDEKHTSSKTSHKSKGDSVPEKKRKADDSHRKKEKEKHDSSSDRHHKKAKLSSDSKSHSRPRVDKTRRSEKEVIVPVDVIGKSEISVSSASPPSILEQSVDPSSTKPLVHLTTSRPPSIADRKLPSSDTLKGDLPKKLQEKDEEIKRLELENEELKRSNQALREQQQTTPSEPLLTENESLKSLGSEYSLEEGVDFLERELHTIKIQMESLVKHLNHSI